MARIKIKQTILLEGIRKLSQKLYSSIYFAKVVFKLEDVFKLFI